MKRSALPVLLGLLLGAAPAAATVAVYEVTFDAVWSQDTHPVDFPGGAHFSGLTGGTHDETLVFWEPGGLASPGMEAMAEQGIGSILRSEVEAAGGTPVFGSNIPFSPDTRTFRLTFDEEQPFLTLVSMVAPSPDWFVGVGGLPLWDDGWLHEVVVDLVPWDAGTDSGPTFITPDVDTVPAEPITEITGFPFTGTGPLGTLTFTLVPGCSDGIDNDDDGLVDHDGGPFGQGPDPRCVGHPERLLEHGGVCGLLGIEPFLVLGGLGLWRRRRSAR